LGGREGEVVVIVVSNGFVRLTITLSSSDYSLMFLSENSTNWAKDVRLDMEKSPNESRSGHHGGGMGD